MAMIRSTMKAQLLRLFVAVVFIASTWAFQNAFTIQSPSLLTSFDRRYCGNWSPLFVEGNFYTQQPEGYDETQNLLAVRAFLQGYYSIFYSILEKNEDVWKAIAEDDIDKGEFGFTIFAPSNDVLNRIGDKKASQLMDPRNLETTQKIAGYHVIGETVTAEQLFNCGGVLTVSGEISVERSITGGMFGIGGQEDGGVLINKARATQTWQVGTGLVHEVDGLVCPNIMWRYMDQLRIPGSS
ncbi:fasciclin domain containing protein [Nitzschia inconspicua]|uniref:Fasciclin domain containing protein n=1 Tax=Nitzschia inconspicua TaxID=303405 RepID=A0A9K3L4J0_9STRA|nr:fasciclin domain containing protein [Nitzschia inconspicua]